MPEMIYRRIQDNGSIVNFNVDKEGTPFIIVTYLGKETRVHGPQAALDKKFAGGTPKYVDDTVDAKAVKLETACDATMATATDACAVMGSIGSLAPDVETAISASETEEKINKLLTESMDA